MKPMLRLTTRSPVCTIEPQRELRMLVDNGPSASMYSQGPWVMLSSKLGTSEARMGEVVLFPLRHSLL